MPDHEKAIALFKQASKEARNPGIKETLRTRLPTIEEHLALAKKLPGNK